MYNSSQIFDLSFCFTGIEFKNRVTGLGADAASVNRWDKSSVKTKFQKYIPWMVFGWCMADKLELDIQDALKDTYFGKVDKLLLCICYFYKQSPKKLRALSEIHDYVKESIEFDA